MDVLVPIDGSDCSFRALKFATEFGHRYEASLNVVHFVEDKNAKKREETQEVIQQANDILDESGIQTEPNIKTDVWITPYTYASRVGKDILKLVDEEGYDHIILGHHGMGVITRALMGSTAETVIRRSKTPVTMIP